MLRAVAERVETHPLLRVALAVLAVGSLLTIAIVNMVGSGARWGKGPWRGPCARLLVAGARPEPGNLPILDQQSFVA